MNKFVLSSSEFNTIKKAEDKINGWWKNGKINNKEVKLFKVIEVYKLKLKFVKEK